MICHSHPRTEQQAEADRFASKVAMRALGGFGRTLVGLAFVCMGFDVAKSSGEASERPNVILVMCDDLGWGDVGFNGGTVIRTPELDRMAAAGLTLRRFYAAAPVCSPTRASCLTGRHPYRMGIYGANVGHMRAEEHTLAELLEAAGYATGHFGKWHLGTLTKKVRDSNRGGPRGAAHFAPPQEHGFDICFSTEAKVPTYDPLLKPRGTSSKKWWDALSPNDPASPYGTRYWNQRGAVVVENMRGDDSRIVMDRVVRFVGEAAMNEQSFFAVVWFHAPHLPVVSGGQHAASYADVEDGYRRNYYGCVSALDEQVGRLRSTLRDLGVAENTIVWFCSDNGPEGKAGNAPGSAGPFRGRKRSLYEGGIRVPSVVEWPAVIAPGSVADVPCVTSDILPTVLESAATSLPDRRPVDGVSLLALFDGSMRRRPKPIGFETRQQVAWSDNQFKLIADPKLERVELYDLVNDPGEQQNVAPQHAELVREMSEDLQAWRANCAASDQGADYANGNRSRDGVWLIFRPKFVALRKNEAAENVPAPLFSFRHR